MKKKTYAIIALFVKTFEVRAKNMEDALDASFEDAQDPNDACLSNWHAHEVGGSLVCERELAEQAATSEVDAPELVAVRRD